MIVAHRMNRWLNRSLIARVLLAGLAFSVASLPAQAEMVQNDRLNPVQGEPLKMRTLENPPLAYTDEDGSITGILVDGIREAVRRTGHDVEFRIYPWKRVLKEVAEGNADGAQVHVMLDSEAKTLTIRVLFSTAYCLPDLMPRLRVCRIRLVR